MRNLLKTLIVGVTVGAVLVILLAYPVYTWLLSTYVAPERAGPHPLLAAGLGLLAALVACATGRLAATWTRARDPWERFAAGAMAGGLAGFVLYAGLGAMAVGIAAQAPLYDVLLPRASISPGESLLKLAIAVNQTFPVTFGVFWSLITGGILIGALTTWRQTTPPSIPTPAPISISISISISIACAWLVLIICLNIVVFALLGEQVQTVFDTFGFEPAWSPLWIWTAMIGQPWLALLALLCVTLRTTLRQDIWIAPHIAKSMSFLMLALLLFWLLLHRPTASLLETTLYLITVVLTLELFLTTWRLRQRAPASTSAAQQTEWIVGGIAGGLLALPLNFQWASLSVSLLTVAVRVGRGMGPFKGAPPPPDLAGLEREFFWPLMELQLLSGLVLLVVHALGGGLMGLALRRAFLSQKLRPVLRLTTGALVVAALAGGFSLLRQSPFLGAALTAALMLALAYRRGLDPPPRLPWLLLALSFICTWLGVLGLALRGEFQVSPGPLLTLAYALLVGPAAAIALLALHVYVPRFRLAACLGVVLLAAWIGHVSEPVLQIKGGVARYDGRRWEVFTPENSTLGGRLNYQFFQDDQGRLWFGGGSGAIAGWVNGRWQSHQLADLFEDADQLVKSQQLGQRARFVQDRQGRLWVALGTLFGQFSPTEDFNMPFWQIEPIALQTPQGTAGTLQLDAPVTDMALDANGDLWLATAGDGALRLDTTRPVDAARWEWFTNRNSSLAADDVYTLYADREGNLWFGTTRGLSRLAGTEWTTFDLPGSPVLALQGDAVGQLWAGTSEGAYVWEGSIWEAVDVQLGSVEVFFLDSQGAMWVGTTTGAWRYDGGRWERIILGAPLTMLAQGPAHVIWLGGPMGLLQYDLTTRETVRFDAQNSGMVADWVRDLFVDAEGGLWVSTFQADQLLPGQLAVTTGIQIAEEARKYADANDGRLVSLLRPEQIERIPWAAAGVSALVFGALLALTWRGYELSPATRARRLVASITAQPQTLYPTAYALAADAPQALDQLACYLSDAGNQAGADVLDAMSALISSDNLSDALTTLISALESPLSPLYRLLDAALSAQRVPEIVGLELAVNPTDQVGQVSLGARGHFIKALPPFSPPGSAEAWRALERVGVVLHKYQQVDAAADRLSYLAEALAAAEAAQSSAGRVGLPDGRVLSAIADRWRLAVTHEINAISGQAELRLELRSRQVQRAPQATLVLRLQNTGRAAAENVRVELKLDTEGAEATVLALERLPAGRSTPLEFDVTPAEAETARVLCQVRWDDRVAAGHALDFADVVRFYATDESFHPIPNPYIVGHPIKSATMFWGREDVFRFMAENLKPDRTFILHGQRRTGKTSILYQLLDGRLGPDFIPVLIDMQELALLVNSTGDLLAEMAHHVARAADRAGIASAAPRPEDFDANPTRAFNRFLDALEQDLGHKRVLLMLDEFELLQAKIAQGKLDPDLPGYFRSLLQHRQRLTFIFSGAHRLEEMSQDYWSVLFNVALYHRVSFLSPAEATRLIREPVAGALDVDELAVEKIIRLTNGHPYFVQLLCWALVNHCNAQKHSYATINDVNDVLQEILTAGAAHLAYVWQQAQNAERLALAGLAHTLRPGKPWVRPAEILETLAAEGAKGIEQTALIKTLDALVAQEILQTAQHGALRYRFQLEVLGLWVARTQSIGALVERGGET